MAMAGLAEQDLPARALYIVALPIGNAADITLRALWVLAHVDAIASEDTRVTARLLAIHGISRPLRRYDEHTADEAGPALLERILGRGSIAAAISAKVGVGRRLAERGRERLEALPSVMPCDGRIPCRRGRKRPVRAAVVPRA